LIPFVAMCFSVALWDRIDPMILGVPFQSRLADLLDHAQQLVHVGRIPRGGRAG